MSTAAEWPVTVQWAQLMLRPLVMSDRGEWDRVRYRNREWLEPWEASNPEAAGTAPSYRSFVRQMRQQARAGQSLPWLITELDPVSRRQELVGQLTVSGITVAMATDYCFQHLRLHRMEINIRPENAKSLRVVEKLGFRDEGLRERFLHIAGRWADHRSFALTAEEVPEGLVRRFTGEDEGITVRRGLR